MHRLISNSSDVDTSANDWLSKYVYLKKLFPDHLIFVEVGDFFEAFLEDAKTIAKELELILTSKKRQDDRISMAGVPAHAIDRYCRLLAAKGFSVYLKHKDQ